MTQSMLYDSNFETVLIIQRRKFINYRIQILISEKTSNYLRVFFWEKKREMNWKLLTRFGISIRFQLQRISCGIVQNNTNDVVQIRGLAAWIYQMGMMDFGICASFTQSMINGLIFFLNFIKFTVVYNKSRKIVYNLHTKQAITNVNKFEYTTNLNGDNNRREKKSIQNKNKRFLRTIFFCKLSATKKKIVTTVTELSDDQFCVFGNVLILIYIYWTECD